MALSVEERRELDSLTARVEKLEKTIQGETEPAPVGPPPLTPEEKAQLDALLARQAASRAS